MKRLPILCLVVAGILYSASAFASVCFLADTACQQGQYQVDDRLPCLDQNSKWIHEGKRCMGLAYGGVVCNDSTGNYFEEGSCPAGYVDFSTVDQDKYECGNSLLCDRCCNNVRCKSKFKKCENNSVPASTNPDDICQEQEPDNTIKYTRCICQKPYEQTCDGKGVTTSGNYCIDSAGQTFWSACQCESGYFETLYSNIKCPSSCTYGCLNLGTYTPLPGTSNYCWSGAECAPEPEKPIETCTIVYQSDFDNFWQGYDAATDCKNLTVDCTTLGYDTGKADTGVMCKDGSEPYRCPFDHTAVYCESGIEESSCEFATQATCEMEYFGSACTPDSKGCWNPNACKDGYGKTTTQCSGRDAGNWSLGNADEYGCALCQCTSTCTNYTGGKPEHAKYTTGTCKSCGKTETVTTGWECISPFVNNESNTDCVCPVVCPEPMTTKPAHSHFGKIECNMCGEIKYIDSFWECDDGFRYEKSCDCCVLDTDCKSFVGTTCMPHAQCTSDTTNGVTIYTFSKCDEANGYFLANCECVCTQTCSDKVTSKPEHSQYVEVDCTACGVSTKIKDHWECDDGYQKSGNSCVLSPCPSGYARNVEGCGQSGGWTLDTSNQSKSGCYKCSANACPLVSVSGFGTGSATRDVQSTTSNNVANCGSYAGNGWTVVATGKYSGNNQCYVCQPNACPTGYKPGVSSVADCGSKAADGWSFTASNLANGNDPCGKCEKLQCPIVQVKYPIEGNSSGDSAYIYKSVKSTTNSSESLCGTQGANGWSTALTGNYSGNDACYVCKPRFCPIGYSTGKTSVDDCGSEGAAGWKFSTASSTAGDEICGKCTRNTTTCPTGYTAGLTSVKTCGDSGEKGWTLQTQGNCGKCVANDCKAGLRESSNERVTVTVKEKNISFRLYLKQGNEYFFTFDPNGYYSGNERCGDFIFSLANFCSEYRREVANCATQTKELSGYEDDDDFWSCVDGVDESWDSHFDNVNRCALCMGVFGSTGDRYFCRDLWHW